jgi:SAM-dependent methyltransferase
MTAVRRLRMLRRHLYSLRSYIPGLRHRHRLEALVGPLGCWEELQRYQFRAVTELGLQPHDTLLDIGCGPLQGGVAFIRYLAPSSYYGVDQKPAALRAGCDELTRQRLWRKHPRLMYSRSFGDDELGDTKFDFIWLSQILYYFDHDALHRLFEMAARRLRSGGVLAGDILGPGSDSSFLREPKAPAHTPDSVDAVARAHQLRAISLGPLHAFGYPRRLNLAHNLLLRVTQISSRVEGSVTSQAASAAARSRRGFCAE